MHGDNTPIGKELVVYEVDRVDVQRKMTLCHLWKYLKKEKHLINFISLSLVHIILPQLKE